MMRLLIVCLVLGVSVTAGASDRIQSDCKAIEMKTLKDQALIDEVSPGAKLVAHDCTVVHEGSSSEKLLVVYHLNAPTSGVESRVALFRRTGLDKHTHPTFVSDSIGFDSFAIVVNGSRHRLLFLIPGENGNKIHFFTNTQTDANTQKFLKHELDIAAKTLTDVPDHAWPVSAGGHEPRIMKEKGKWRGIVADKLVDL